MSDCHKCGAKSALAVPCRNRYCDAIYCSSCFRDASFTLACCKRDRCTTCDAAEKKREMFSIECRAFAKKKKNRHSVDVKDSSDTKLAQNDDDHLNDKRCSICGTGICFRCGVGCRSCFQEDEKYYSSIMCRICALGSHCRQVKWNAPCVVRKILGQRAHFVPNAINLYVFPPIAQYWLVQSVALASHILARELLLHRNTGMGRPLLKPRSDIRESVSNALANPIP